MSESGNLSLDVKQLNLVTCWHHVAISYLYYWPGEEGKWFYSGHQARDPCCKTFEIPFEPGNPRLDRVQIFRLMEYLDVQEHQVWRDLMLVLLEVWGDADWWHFKPAFKVKV
jgi:hypothetical protein